MKKFRAGQVSTISNKSWVVLKPGGGAALWDLTKEEAERFAKQLNVSLSKPRKVPVACYPGKYVYPEHREGDESCPCKDCSAKYLEKQLGGFKRG
jgi:hypothetical protein